MKKFLLQIIHRSISLPRFLNRTVIITLIKENLTDSYVRKSYRLWGKNIHWSLDRIEWSGNIDKINQERLESPYCASLFQLQGTIIIVRSETWMLLLTLTESRGRGQIIFGSCTKISTCVWFHDTGYTRRDSAGRQPVQWYLGRLGVMIYSM